MDFVQRKGIRKRLSYKNSTQTRLKNADSDHVKLFLVFLKGLKQVTWHGKGDYFATVMPDGSIVIMALWELFFYSLLGGHASVLIHQLSKRKSQVSQLGETSFIFQFVLDKNPLKKIKGKVQKVLFHPTHPHFLVAVRKNKKIPSYARRA